MNNFNEISCPVCKVTGVSVISGYDYKEVSDYFCPIERNAVRNQQLRTTLLELWQTERVHFLRCTSCGFGFGWPFIGGNEEFYKLLHEQAGYPKSRWEYDYVKTRISDDNSQSLLDIGAGAGYFLDKFNHIKKFAVEGSETTRIILRKKGVEVIDLDKSDSYNGSIHCITMFQVLEHISYFRKYIEGCYKLLANGGSLYISVPDCDAMIRQEKYTGCPDYPPNHINKWTPDSLNLVLKESGFHSQEVVFESNSVRNFLKSVHLKILFKAKEHNSIPNYIYRIQNRKLRKFVVLGWSLFEIPLLIGAFSQLRKGGSFLIRAEKIK